MCEQKTRKNTRYIDTNRNNTIDKIATKINHDHRDAINNSVHIEREGASQGEVWRDD